MATYEAEAAKVGGVPTVSPGTPEPPGQKIGIDFWPMPNGLMILRVASGSAAEKAGLQPSQLIEAINGTPMKGVTAPEAIKLIAGSVGVTLKIADVGDIKVR